MKSKKIWALLLIAVVLSGCASKSGYTNMTEPQQAPAADRARSELYMTDTAADYDGYNEKGDMAEPAGGTVANVNGAVNPSVPETERKIIKTAYFSIETYDFDGSVNTLLQDIVLRYAGYVEKADTSVYRIIDDIGLKSGNYVVRVPQEQFEAARSEIEKIGKVLNSTMGGDDVTGQYYDIQSRLDIKKEEEKRIIQLIERAERIEDLINLEQRLSQIRTDIEIYQTRLNSIDRLSSYSTITVNLTEIREKDKIVYSDDFLGKLKSNFAASINFVIACAEGIALFIVAVFIPALILGVIGFVVWRFIKKRKTKM